jgi:hypothetical protein
MTIQKRPLDIGMIPTTELIQKALTDFTREDLYISIPATVTEVNEYETKQVVSVKPVINDEYKDNQLVKAITIKSVFVKIPSGGGFSIKLPIAVGDLVTLHWAHRNISTFLDGQGADVDEPIDMVADIRDCWVTHGFGTRSNNQKPSQKDYIVVGPNSKHTITPEGKSTLELPKTTQTILPNGNMTTETEGTSYIKSSDHTIDTDVTITGNLHVIGDSATDGKLSSETGTFSPTYSGPLGGGAGSMTIGDITSSGTVTINGITVNGHDHSNPEGGNTGPMQ